MSRLPSIAIVGDFDSGKSTTFNALCDGRDISPRRLFGGDLKTNSVLIAAESIIGDETKDGLAEWAEVSFKTPEEIDIGLASILRQPLMDSTACRKYNAMLSDEQFKAAMSTDDDFLGLVDLDNDECRAALIDAANALWGKWQENRASLSYEELDELRIATLQLRFYGSAEYREMTSRTVFSLDTFQNLLTVPKNWMIRWENGPDSWFMLDEVDPVAGDGRSGADLCDACDHVLAVNDLDQGLDGGQVLVQALAQEGQVVDTAFQLVDFVDDVGVTPRGQQGCHQKEYRQ